MHLKMKPAARCMVQVAVLASLAGAASLPSAIAAPAAGDEQMVSQAETQARASWREDISHTTPPAEGCFHATYPSILWKQVGCQCGDPTQPSTPTKGVTP